MFINTIPVGDLVEVDDILRKLDILERQGILPKRMNRFILDEKEVISYNVCEK